MAIKPNRRICSVPLAAYHIPPEMPYVYAKVDEVRSVADQVHDDTIPEAINPGLTERDAVLNSSALAVE